MMWMRLVPLLPILNRLGAIQNFSRAYGGAPSFAERPDSPLKKTNDIHALEKSMGVFKDKGYEGKGLMKLLIVTHRLWTPKRMVQFVGSI